MDFEVSMFVSRSKPGEVNLEAEKSRTEVLVGVVAFADIAE